MNSNDVSGRAFICYVREDRQRVDRLQRVLEAAGIRVWRDTTDLWPGQDWKLEIRRAIQTGSLAFIACFSENSQQREQSYQNEELLLAVEQMRRRPPGREWLIPVRFAECDIPALDLGAGRTLQSLHHIDLPDGPWEPGDVRLVAAVLRIVNSPSIISGSGQFRQDSESGGSTVGGTRDLPQDVRDRTSLPETLESSLMDSSQVAHGTDLKPSQASISQSHTPKIHIFVAAGETGMLAAEELDFRLSIERARSFDIKVHASWRELPDFGQYPLAAISAAIGRCQYGVLVLAPEETAALEGIQSDVPTASDHRLTADVQFLLGLMIGFFGTQRTFLVLPRNEAYRPRLATLLTGLPYAEYDVDEVNNGSEMDRVTIRIITSISQQEAHE